MKTDMSTPSMQPRLFGLDLAAVWREVRQAWGKLLHLPLLAWLGPQPSILLHEVEGSEGCWRPSGEGAFIRQSDGSASASAAFRAVELPEEIVLRKQLVLPPLADDELRSAIALQAQAVSPFPASDLVWGWGLADGAEHRSGRIQAELVLASRKSIDQYCAQRAPQGAAVEIWVRSAGRKNMAIGLRGFAEGMRQRAQRRGWAMLGVVLVLCAALLLAIAVTPVLQLRERALQAVAAFNELTERARPHVAKREALLAANEQVRTLEAIVGNRLNPLQTMQILTVVLGDDTVLQRLQIEGRNVTIAGQTPDTSAMMQKLSAHPGFKGVRAPAAATRPPGATKETFQVEFSIDADSTPVAPAAPASGASS